MREPKGAQGNLREPKGIQGNLSWWPLVIPGDSLTNDVNENDANEKNRD